MASKSPDAFRTISEVADWLGVQPHVLRFWESKFSQVKPVKRAGGRRYYRPNDMLLLGGIKQLLHEDGLTIKGAQKVLREHGMAHVSAMSKPLDEESAALAEEAAALDLEPDVPEAGFMDAPEAEEPVAAFPVADEEPEPAPEQISAPDPVAPAVTADDPIPEPDNPTLPSFITESPAEPAPVAVDNMPPAAWEAAEMPPPEEAHPEFEDFDAPAEMTSAPEIAEEPTAEPEVAPKPHIVDAPDPDESGFVIQPGALSTVFRTTGIAEQDSSTLTPLVAQLAALRDRMAAARGR